MKKLTLILLLGWSSALFSQDKYTKFVEKSSVMWAADISDTLHFSNPNLSLLLRERLIKGEIKASILENEPGSTVEKKMSIETITSRVAPNRIKQIVDEDGNTISTIIEAENPLLSFHYFDSQTNDILEVKQVLYVESGKLRSYIPWISPKYSVYTSWGEKLGIANAFSTAFKLSRGMSKSATKKAMMLGTTFTKISLDTSVKRKMLKQLYGYNLLEALWPDLSKKNYEIYEADSFFRIPVSKMTLSLINPQIINIPLYDEEGNISNQQISGEDQLLTPSSFTTIELIQNWFYHAKSNTAFSSITQIILHAFKWNNGKKDNKESAILKIMLK